MLIRVHNRGVGALVLRLAWGPRRITSKTRYGKLESAYPNSVTSSHGLWLSWIWRSLPNWLFWNVQVVVPPSRATARVDEAVAGLSQPTASSGRAMPAEEVEKLLAERRKLRATRRFEEADNIRDLLVANGVDVKDERIDHVRQGH